MSDSHEIVPFSPGRSLATHDTAVRRPSAFVLPGSLMQVAGGNLSADLRSTGRHSDDGSEIFELLISNDTPEYIGTVAYTIESHAAFRRRTVWNETTIEPFSAACLELLISFNLGSETILAADIYFPGGQLTILPREAAPSSILPRSIPSKPKDTKVPVAFGIIGVVVALSFWIAPQMATHVSALAAPPSVPIGSTFSVAYAVENAFDANYVVTTPDGTSVAGGILPDHSGSFGVTIPKTKESVGYDVKVFSHGRFGTDSRTVHVVASPEVVVVDTHAAPPFHIGEVKLSSTTVFSGKSLNITYAKNLPSGEVRLIDSQGTVRAESLMTSRGISILQVPLVATDQDFRVVLLAQRGTYHDEVSTSVTILAVSSSPPPLPSVLTPPVALLQTLPLTHSFPPPTVSKPVSPLTFGMGVGVGDIISVLPNQTAGRPIFIAINRYKKDMHVALMGVSNEELASADVTPGEKSIQLTPPDYLAEKHYEIVVTYSTGNGQETIIRPISFR